MKTKRNAFASLCLALLLAGPAHAAIMFTANLDAAQEVPAGASTSAATGIASLTLNDAQTRLEMTLQLTGLDLGGQTADVSDDVTRLHIHLGAVGTNGPIVFGLIDPNNDVNGDRVINAVAGTVFSAWDESTEGNATTLGAQLTNLLNGNLYFNVHTPEFPAGAIRGQILEAPEPTVLWLLGLGFAAIGIGNNWRRRRQQRTPV